MANKPLGEQFNSILAKTKDFLDVETKSVKSPAPTKPRPKPDARSLATIKDKRIVSDLAALGRLADALRELQHRMVVTIGTFDMLHIGHSRYLEKARSLGDTLIVGVDSDRAVKVYKGPQRPMVPEGERLEMLLHTRYVDWVTLVDDVNDVGAWQFALIKAVRPDTFVAVEDSYSQTQLSDIKRFSKNVVVLPRQASTSTSETIRRAMIAEAKPVSDQLRLLAQKIDKGEL